MTIPARALSPSSWGRRSMNLISGRVDDGRFRLGGIDVMVPGAADAAEATLGIRCEDLQLCDPTDAGIVGTVYASELIGDATLVTVAAEDHHVIAKVGKDHPCQIRRAGRAGDGRTELPVRCDDRGASGICVRPPIRLTPVHPTGRSSLPSRLPCRS